MIRKKATGASGARIVPWMVFALGIGTTVFLYGSLSRALSRRNDESFGKARANIVAEMRGLVRRQSSVLYATAGAIKADPGMTQNRFDLFLSSLKRGESANLATTIGFSRSTPPSERDDLLREARVRGISGFALPPNRPGPWVQSVMLSDSAEPVEGVKPGTDLGRLPSLQSAMDAAERRNGPAMTADAAVQNEATAWLFVPVEHPLSDAFYGLAFSAIPTQQFFEPLFLREEEPINPLRTGVGLRLWTETGGVRRTLFHHPALGKKVVFQHSQEVELGEVGLTLHAEFTRSEKFGAQATIQQYVPWVGGIISLMLFFLARSLRLSYEATARRAQEQELLGEVGRLTSVQAEEQATLSEIAKRLADAFDATSRIDLLEADGTLRTVETQGLPSAAQIEREYPRLQHDPLLRAAMETGTTQRADFFNPENADLRQRTAEIGVGPLVVVPMQARERFIGAITLVRARGQGGLPTDAVTTIEAVAARLALAIDNTRLFRATQEEIVERRAAEAEVRRLNEELEEIVAERTRDLQASNHELESFCYSVSHDLRTPLRSLDGFSRALKEDYGEGLDEQAHDYIDRIRASTRRMDELITGLLTLSRLTRSEIVPVVNDVTAQARYLTEDLDPEGRTEFQIDEGVRVYADPRMLAIVLENLLGNAVKFTRRTDKPTIRLGRLDDGTLFVRDNGAGFDPAYGSKLFMPFERLHSVREFPGHGIGLATVERVVRRHGGSVRAEGKPGEGATFYVCFPDPK